MEPKGPESAPAQLGVVQNVDAETLALWTGLREPSSLESFYASWLALQCRLLPRVKAGLLRMGPADTGPFEPVARWPHVEGDSKRLTAAADRAIAERRGLVLRAGRGTGRRGKERYELAQPVEIAGRLRGAVALELESGSSDLARTLFELRWGMAWLELFELRREHSDALVAVRRVQGVLELLVAIAERDQFQAAATHFATEVATALGCQRASLGVQRRGHIVLAAMSHSARFSRKANLVRAIEAAMDEAADQCATVVHPAAQTGGALVRQSHEELSRRFEAGAICSVPLVRAGKVCGALTLEREEARPFDPETVALCEALGAMSGPLLEVQRREDRWLVTKAADAARGLGTKLLGPHHVALKLAAAAFASVVLFLAVAKGDFRVTSDAILEPELQRAAVAPFDGFLAESPVRPGDLVERGDLLVRLDERDLQLERSRWDSQVDQLARQHREALSERNAAEVSILQAGIDQARAQLGLIQDRLSRARLVAPFDGVVVEGDLSQVLGAPVRRGDLLLAVAPLEAYRLVLQVDEHSIREVRVGQRGSLVLAAAPNETLAFSVGSITPVSEAKEGRNYFRVEAVLDAPSERLRPGMEGVGKIEVDRRRLVWIWTHEIVDWFRLWLWSWMP